MTTEKDRVFLIMLLLVGIILQIPYVTVYGVIGALVLCFFYNKSFKFKVSSSFLLLLVFALTYILFDSYFTEWSYMQLIRSLLYIPVMFFIGQNITLKGTVEERGKKVGYLYQAVGTSYFLILFIGLIYSIVSGYTFSERMMLLPWIEGLGATHIGSMSVVAIGLSLWGIIYCSAIKKVMYVCMLLIMIYVNVMVGNRMILVMAPAISIMAIYAYVKSTEKKGKALLKAITVLTLIIGIGFICWKRNVFGLQTWYYSTQTFSRLEEIELEDPRLTRQLYIIIHFFDNMFGGSYFSKVSGNPHNVWLNIYDSAGIIPFLIFVIYTIISIKQMIICLKSKRKEISLLVFCVNTSFFLAFATEPVMESVESMLWILAFLQGLLLKWNIEQKECEILYEKHSLVYKKQNQGGNSTITST